jgi:hypothetical protein
MSANMGLKSLRFGLRKVNRAIALFLSRILRDQGLAIILNADLAFDLLYLKIVSDMAPKRTDLFTIAALEFVRFH